MIFASGILADQFSTPAMRAALSDTARLAGWLAFETALARVQADMGLIPADVPDTVAKVTPARFDMARLKTDFDRSGVVIVAFLAQMRPLCGAAGQHVHMGATTQDVLDTGFSLQLRDALDLIGADLDMLVSVLAGLARQYRDTVMAGRSFQQQAVPITFGYKVAVWLDEVLRHRDRLTELRPRLLTAQFGGAVGTLAPLGDQGLAVRAGLARALDLADPAITWHAARDRWAELTGWAAMLGATLGKIGLEVSTLMRSEVSEIAEAAVPGRGGSSTMPQKRNPVTAPQLVAIGRALQGLPAAELSAMMQEHERGIGSMPLEWAVVPQALALLSGSLAQAVPMLAGLEVDAARMRANLDAGGGLLMAEAAMTALAPLIGRDIAHAAVTRAARAVPPGGMLRDTLLADPAVAGVVSPAALDAILDPASYTGSAGAMVDAVLART